MISWVRNKGIPWFTSLGLTRRTVTLQVPGRRTGNPVRVSLSLTQHNGNLYLVSLGGESNWVKNVRAAQGKAIIRSRKQHHVQLQEVPHEEKAPILLAYIQKRAFSHSGEEAAQLFFGLDNAPQVTLADMDKLKDSYPIFQIQGPLNKSGWQKWLSIDI
jgi:deazaflavin-dependent oxidoreductase (nitroreductase family)